MSRHRPYASRGTASRLPSRLLAFVLPCSRAEVRLYVPLEVAVKRLRVEVVEEVNAPKAKIPETVNIAVAVDFDVVRLDAVALVVESRADAEVVATVGVGIRIFSLIDIWPDNLPLHAKTIDNCLAITSLRCVPKLDPRRR